MAEAMGVRCGRLKMRGPGSAKLESKDSCPSTHGAVLVITSRKDFHEASGIVFLFNFDCQRNIPEVKLTSREKIRDLRVGIPLLHEASYHLQLQHMIHVEGVPL